MPSPATRCACCSSGRAPDRSVPLSPVVSVLKACASRAEAVPCRGGLGGRMLAGNSREEGDAKYENKTDALPRRALVTRHLCRASRSRPAPCRTVPLMSASNCKVPWWTNVSERSLLACCWVVFLGGLSLLLWGDAIEPGWIAEVITLILASFMLALVFVVGYSVKWERKPRPPRPLPNSSAMSVSNCKVPWWTNVGERSLLRCLGVVFLGYLSLSLWGDAIEPGWIAEVITLILAVFFLALAVVVGCSVKWERKS